MNEDNIRTSITNNKYIVIACSEEEIIELKKYLNDKHKTTYIYDIKEQDPETIIDRYLLELSAPPNLKGFKYIRDAIYISINDQKNNIKMYKGLYSYLSKKYDTSSSAVESAMRRLVNKVTEELPYDLKQEIFKSVLYNNEEERIPSNGLFIKIMSEKINNELKINKGNTLFL
jgi:two-component system response regulator (stage 0 sporulation protein A)